MNTCALIIAAALAAAPATGTKTELTIEVKPAEAVYVLDGAHKGSGKRAKTYSVKPGTHMIKIKWKGDEHQEPIYVKKGEKKKYVWEFEDDRPAPMRAKRDPDETTITDGPGTGGAPTPESSDEAPAPKKELSPDSEPSDDFG